MKGAASCVYDSQLEHLRRPKPNSRSLRSGRDEKLVCNPETSPKQPAVVESVEVGKLGALGRDGNASYSPVRDL